MKDAGKSRWLWGLSEYVPAECVAMEMRLQKASASLEALEALVSWSKRADVDISHKEQWQDQLNILIQIYKVCHLPVLLQVVAEVWMEVVAYPDKKGDPLIY